MLLCYWRQKMSCYNFNKLTLQLYLQAIMQNYRLIFRSNTEQQEKIFIVLFVCMAKQIFYKKLLLFARLHFINKEIINFS
jgi:hypothetical protein